MKISLAPLLLLLPTTTLAWISRTPLNMMGSRGSEKWDRKKAWLEKRGLDENGLPLTAATTTTAPSSTTYTIIGGGRIGSLLASSDKDDSCNTLLLKRGDAIPPDGTGPILIATRNDALEGIVAACPPSRTSDLVFLQNGYLDDFLSSQNLSDNTQVLLYLSVAALGAPPVDGITSFNPEGLTAATGVHAGAFRSLLAGLGLTCQVVSGEGYRPAMFEKLIWIATYMLVGAAKGCRSVGQAGSEHAELVERVVNELVAAVSEKEGITFPDGTMDRLKAYTDVVSDFPAAVKEFEWRNQYFYNLGDDACPTHNGLLRECKEKGILSFDLP